MNDDIKNKENSVNNEVYSTSTLDMIREPARKSSDVINSTVLI